MAESFLLIDGNNLLFRAYYGWAAHAPTPEARSVQTAIGFLALAMRPIRQIIPSHVAIIFDADGPSFRHDADASYKANRQRPADGEDHPERHLESVRGHLSRLGFQNCVEMGVEADDVIASAAVEASVLGLQSVIYSSDRDFLQLVTEEITVQAPVVNQAPYSPEEVWRKFRVHPHQFVDFKSLQGDPSDNLPGVPGIGPKTAAALLGQHETVDQLYERLWLAPAKLASALQEYEPRVRHNQAMIALRCDLPLAFSLDNCRIESAILHLNPFQAILRPENGVLQSRSLSDAEADVV